MGEVQLWAVIVSGLILAAILPGVLRAGEWLLRPKGNNPLAWHRPGERFPE
jgi:hypothetical protein